MNDSTEHSLQSIVGRLERLPFSPFKWRVASVLAVGTFFDAYDSAVIGIALAVIVVSFKVTFVTAGLLISGGYVGQFIGALVFGGLAERYGRKPAFVWTLAIFGIFSLFAAFATSFESLLFWRVLQGVGLGAEVPLAGALFNELVRGATRGKVVIIYESAFTWGLLAAPLIGGPLIATLGPNHGWRAMFILGAIPLVVALIAWRSLPESPRWLASRGRIAEADAIVATMEAEARQRGHELPPLPHVPYVETKPTSFGEMFQGIYARRTILSWVQWFTTYFAVYGYAVWLPLLYVRVSGLAPGQAIALTLVPGAVQVVTSYVVAFTIDRVGRKIWFAGGFAVAALAMAGGVVLTVGFGLHNWQVLFGVGFFASLGSGINAIGVYLYTPELFPTRMRAWATSTGSAANRLASAIAPLAIGALLGAGLGIGSVFALLGFVLLIGLVVMLGLGIETKDRVLEDLSP